MRVSEVGLRFIALTSFAHRAGLVRQLARHDRPFRRLRRRAQDVVPPLGPHRLPSASALYSIRLPSESRIGMRCGAAPPSATSTRRTPRVRSASACGHDVGERVVRLAVGEHHEHAVGAVAAGREQLRALLEHGARLLAALAGEVGIEPVQVHAHRAAVHGERRQDVAPPGERDEAEPVALEILDQAPASRDGALRAGWARRPPPASSG